MLMLVSTYWNVLDPTGPKMGPHLFLLQFFVRYFLDVMMCMLFDRKFRSLVCDLDSQPNALMVYRSNCV